MKWLVVLGEGDWIAGRGERYSPGKHEVADDVAERARRSGLRRLLLLDDEPTVLWHGREDGPLTLEHVRRGQPSGVYVPVAAHDEPAPDEPDRPPLDHHCLFCPETFPSAGSLKRHVEFHHSGEM